MIQTPLVPKYIYPLPIFIPNPKSKDICPPSRRHLQPPPSSDQPPSPPGLHPPRDPSRSKPTNHNSPSQSIPCSSNLALELPDHLSTEASSTPPRRRCGLLCFLLRQQQHLSSYRPPERVTAAPSSDLAHRRPRPPGRPSAALCPSFPYFRASLFSLSHLFLVFLSDTELTAEAVPAAQAPPCTARARATPSLATRLRPDPRHLPRGLLPAAPPPIFFVHGEHCCCPARPDQVHLRTKPPP